MTRARAAILWTMAFASATLLLASIAGDGAGPAGYAPLRHMGWSFAFVGVAGVLVYLLATLHPTPPPSGGGRT